MRLLLLNNGIVTEVVVQDNYIVDKEMHPFDTIIVDDVNLFTIDELYSVDEYTKRVFVKLSPSAKLNYTREIMSMSKEQAAYALIAKGFKDIADSKVRKLGSASLRTAWVRPNAPYTRLCAEVLEMITLLGITDTQADELFTIGSAINLSNIQGTTSVTDYFEIAKYELRENLKFSFEQEIADLTASVSMDEKVSWVKQETEARAWNLNNTSSTPLIDGLLTSRNFGETKQVLVDKIIINADRYSVMYSNILGKFQNLSALLNTVASVTDIKQISW